MNTQHSIADLVAKIGTAIATCDFRVTVSRYINGKGRPWVITVGESSWQRHLVVEEVNEDGSDAELAILTKDQSTRSGYDIDCRSVEHRVSLKDLVAASYMSVKDILLHGKCELAQ